MENEKFPSWGKCFIVLFFFQLLHGGNFSFSIFISTPHFFFFLLNFSFFVSTPRFFPHAGNFAFFWREWEFFGIYIYFFCIFFSRQGKHRAPMFALAMLVASGMTTDKDGNRLTLPEMRRMVDYYQSCRYVVLLRLQISHIKNKCT